ncbi:SLC38A6 [Symbiodinium necroappetens]|uniref:SLC38A6 protein n=1 Tax=Symbiodinium necroappetens TaxID=1628268 RepID=A0A812XPJ0_9DINO|nr:SLC38A6 [Symbiodinium necroappetens]|eukprot:CAMPEP_0181412792 /NCGR_PEP_ID=MMETSP1110-20121109/8616_1 /TAXON_ID=174948 /ORGANISM="Symbiodinium sp., Strain CCMP421" /LENGTH=486 /DNA_ID=CAMNT_0023535539 /DNA_START=35 /DNA_END=1495 /DNA_ORIENTATION=-
MAGFSQSTPGKPRSAVESIMLLLAAGIGSGVMVLPRAMAAVGPGAMLVLFIGGWLISSVTTWILFSAVTEARRQPETIMSISSRLLSNSMSSHSLVGLISPQAARGLDTPTAREPHDPHALLSPTAATVLERKRSTSVYDFKDRKSSKQTARVVEQAHLPGPSYGDLLAMVWPPSYMTLLDLVLLVHQLLALTVYFLFISEFMAKLPLVSECPSPVVILILAVPASLLAQLESVGGLARLASISPFALLFMMFGVFYRYHYPDSGMAPSDFSTAEPDHEAIPSVMCVAVFSFMWHTNCVTVARELRDPSATCRLFVVLTATTVLLFAYTSLAYFGYETFGQELRKVPTIMMLYSGDDPIFMTVRVLLSCSLFVAIPLNVYPVRESILNQVRFHSSGACFEAAIQRQNYISICLVFVPAILAIVIPSVTEIITVIGGSLVTFLMIVFPVFISELVLPETAVLLLKFLALLVVPSLVAASFKLIGKPF